MLARVLGVNSGRSAPPNSFHDFVTGTLTLRLAGKDPGGRRTALALLLSAWCCGVVTGVIGMWVSAVTTHAW